MRTIMHIDVNNAFLSWHAVYLLRAGYKTDIRNINAVISSGRKGHGMVLAKSPGAKALGVKTTDKVYKARRLCPNLKEYEPIYNWYSLCSRKMFELIEKYTCDIEKASIDECFIDYTKVLNLYKDPVEFAYKLKEEIFNTLGFTVNIGIGNNKLCAKMASDLLKPNRVHTLFDNEIESKMYPLPIEDLYGCGRATYTKLKKLDINTIGDLAHYDSVKLSVYFKKRAYYLVSRAEGFDDSEVVVNRESVSIGNSTTVKKDLEDKKEIYRILTKLSENVGRELRSKHKYAYVVCVNLRDCLFTTYNHQKKMVNATNSSEDITKVAIELFNEMFNDNPVRLLGVSVSKFVDENNYQLSMFEKVNKLEENAAYEKVIDDLISKYGEKVIKKGFGSKYKKKY